MLKWPSKVTQGHWWWHNSIGHTLLSISGVYLVSFLRYSASMVCLNCIKNKIIIWRKTIFNMADWILTPCNVIRGSGMTCHWIRPNVRHIGILQLVSISTHHRSRHVILYQSAKFYPNRTILGRKRWRHIDFQDGVSQPSWIVGIQ